MNSHELDKILDMLEQVDGEATTLGEALDFFVNHGDDVKKALRELILGLPDHHWQAVVARISEPGFAASLLPYQGAVEAVIDVAERHDVFFVTSPWRDSPTWTHDRDGWLVRHFGKTLGSRVVHTAHKDLVVGDVLIEDKVETFDAWERAGDAATWHGARKAVVVDRPYNRIMSHRYLSRVKTLVEVGALLP